MAQDRLFEAPVQEMNYSNPYSSPEFEDEWETNPESHYSHPYSNPEQEWEATNYSNPYSNPEFEGEWETNPETHYSHPYSNPEQEWEATNYSNPYSHPEANPYSNPEYEDEWETHETHEVQYSNPYSHPEAQYNNPYSNPEYEDEGEYFFGKKFFRNIGRGLTKLARFAAPFGVKALTSLIPGAGPLIAPFAGQLTRQILREAEMEAEQMEAEFFGANEAEFEVANTEIAHEAALSEFLAAQAAEAATESEAEAHIGATLPLTITITSNRQMRNIVRPVMPVLSQATGTLAKSLIQHGPKGRQLLRLVPTIQRRTMTTLKALSRGGQPINSTTAVKAMAAATNRVLNNPNLVQRAVMRNQVLRQRTAPHPGQMGVGTRMRTQMGMRMPIQCPTCAARISR